jgi:hypothetical protein
VPEEEGAVVLSFPNEKIEVILLERGVNGDAFALSADLIDTLSNAKAPGWPSPNTAVVVENALFDVALVNTLSEVDVDMLASPLGYGTLNLSKILLETPCICTEAEDCRYESANLALIFLNSIYGAKD